MPLSNSPGHKIYIAESQKGLSLFKYHTGWVKKKKKKKKESLHGSYILKKRRRGYLSQISYRVV